MSAIGTTWQGQLWLAKDFALLHGMAGATEPHAHYAHQILLSPESAVSVRLASGALTAHRVLIESMVEHSILSAEEPLFTIYAEPLAFQAQTLFDEVSSCEPSPHVLSTTLQRMPRQPLSDSRVAKAIESVDAMLSEKVRAAELAHQVSLSLSQLERLFRAHVGIPIRRLVQWRRMRLALVLALSGNSLTEAACSAGFADSAHFSRTMRSLFGVRADRTLSGFKIHLVD